MPTLSAGDGHIASSVGVKDASEAFETIWREALRQFRQSADISETRWKLQFERMSRCLSVDDVLVVLDETTQKLDHSRGAHSKWRDVRNKYLKPTIQAILLLNEALAETASVFPAIPGGKAIFVAVGMLLEATNGVDERFDALIGLLEQLNFYLETLRIRLAARSGLGPASRTISIAILAHLLDVISIARKIYTPSVWRARLASFRKALTKDEKIQKALDRLRTLTDLETRATAVETQVSVSEIQTAMGQSHLPTAAKLGSAVSDLQKLTDTVSLELQKMHEVLFSAAEESHSRSGVDVKAERSRLLGMVSRVDSADIDAQDPNGCLEGTRVEILAELLTWSRDSDAPPIYWLNGMAGIGKSAIARSFCRDLRNKGQLGGSFFCSRRGTVEQTDAKRIVPTLAVSLALRDSHCTSALLAELDTYPISRYWNFDVQIEHFLKKPFTGIEPNSVPPPVMVIDALDECSDSVATYELILRLVEKARDLPIKFFLTSRPEPHIRQHLERLDPALGQVLRLHDVEQDTVKMDISLYLTHGLQGMRKQLPQSSPAWPHEADIDALTRLSGRLFIYAFTALMYVRKNPIERLAKLTGTVVTAGQVLNKPLDEIYTLILSDAMNPDDYEADEIDLVRRIMAVIVHLREPLTVVALAGLLSMPTYRVRTSLDRLYAVIYVPIHDNRGFLSTFHASFGDFLTTSGRAPDYMHDYIHDSHFHLADACMRQLRSEELCFDISRARTSYLLNAQQELARMNDALRYACLHWSYHVLKAVNHSSLILTELEDVFMGLKFLFWLEALSAMDLSHKAHDALTAIRDSRCSFSLPFSQFIEDAVNFVETFKHPISQSAPHIYLSALAFWPRSSPIRQHCSRGSFNQLAKLISRKLFFPAHVTPDCSALSQDGGTISLGLSDGNIGLWDVSSGELVTPLLEERQCRITSPVVSPSGDRVACGSYDGRLRIWDVATRVFQSPLRSFATLRGPISCLAFSPDGTQVASGSEDGKVGLHDATTGALLRPTLVHSTSTVICVAFSPDGHKIIYGARNGTVLLWDTKTKASSLQHMTGYGNERILSVIFSLDGLRILSGSESGTVCIWDAYTCELMSTVNPPAYLSEHYNPPSFTLRGWRLSGSQSNVRLCRSLGFSSDGRQVVTISYENTVRVWDLETNSFLMCAPLQGDTRHFQSVKLTADGHVVLSHTDNLAVHHIWSFDVDGPDHVFRPEASLPLTDTPRKYLTHPECPTLRLAEDGWIMDDTVKPPSLLLWIPPDRRKALYLSAPFMELLLAPYATHMLDMSDFTAHGARWTECYQETGRT